MGSGAIGAAELDNDRSAFIAAGYSQGFLGASNSNISYIYGAGDTVHFATPLYSSGQLQILSTGNNGACKLH